MDGTAAIKENHEALKRILAGLVAMAGLGAHPGVRAEDEPRRTLPRHLYLAILRLLRPAEAAARRLIIAAARGLVVPAPRLRKSRLRPMATEPFLRRFGIAVVVSPTELATAAAARRAAASRAARPRALSLPLLDPLRRPLSLSKGRGCGRHASLHAVPRILYPGVTEPFSLPPSPSPDDPVDAMRLGLRLAALAAALDDLQGQAKRFARWRAIHNARREVPAPGRIRRASPLRPGRPPGGRMVRYDPAAAHPRNVRDIDEILAHAHALALYALQYPDTS